MIYESKIYKRINRAKLAMSDRLSPDMLLSKRLELFSRGGSVRRSFNKRLGDIQNKDTHKPNHVEKTLEKVYKRIQDVSDGKLRQK